MNNTGLLKVVEKKQASRGILETTSTFTKSAIKEAKTTGRLELINYDSLQFQLNQYFGPNWPTQIDSEIEKAQRLIDAKNLHKAELK